MADKQSTFYMKLSDELKARTSDAAWASRVSMAKFVQDAICEKIERDSPREKPTK